MQALSNFGHRRDADYGRVRVAFFLRELQGKEIAGKPRIFNRIEVPEAGTLLNELASPRAEQFAGIDKCQMREPIPQR